MTRWDALDYLNTLVDDSDPDIELAAARAPAADRRSDPRRRASGLVRADRLHPRPGQGAVPLRRAAVGRRRRHVSHRLPLFAERIVYREFFADNPDAQRPEFQTGTGIYARGLRPVATCTCRGATTNTCITSTRDYLPAAGAVHDPLPFVLRLAPRRRVRLPAGRPRSRDAAVGAEVQSRTTCIRRVPTARRLADLKPYYEDLMAKYLPATVRF